MRYILTILIVLQFLFTHGQEIAINIMSFNIRYPNTGDGIHYWDKRRPLVKSLIQYHEADIIGVQEAHRRQLDEMIVDMPEYKWTGVCRTDGTAHPDPDNEFSAILYRKDKFAVLEESTFWLSENPDEKGSRGWDAALPRIVSWAKMKHTSSGKIFYHFNTHFDHMGVKAREESARLLLLKIDLIAGTLPVLVTGDFNCSDADTPYMILTNPASSVHLKDAYRLTAIPHHGPVASFASNFMMDGLNDHRIDYIFLKNGWNVQKHAILSDSWHGLLASDHLPVFATVTFK